MEERDIVALDLFGEPVTESPRRGGGKARLPYKSSSRPSEAATEPDPSRFTLPLPALLSVDGSIESNPFRQYGKRARALEGTFESFSFKQLMGFRFRSTSGETFIIVPRKTLTVVDGEPVLLVADAETPEAIEDALTRGRGIWLSPKPAKPVAVPVEQSGDLCRRILETWRGKFTCREGHRETETTPAVPGSESRRLARSMPLLLTSQALWSQPRLSCLQVPARRKLCWRFTLTNGLSA